MEKLNDYKAVVFDMDGVIFDSESTIQDCWEITAKKYNLPNMRETCMKCLGISTPGVIRIFKDAYGEDFPFEAYSKETAEIFAELYGEGRLPMKPGIKELLEFLKSQGKKIALASSTHREKVTQEITDAGLLDYFEILVCGDMVERSKPDPDIFLKACKAIGVDPKDAYAIEDSYNGIRSANRAGMHPIMVPDLLPPDEEMKSLTEAILPSLFDVIDYLR